MFNITNIFRKNLKLDPCFFLFWCENSTPSVSLVVLQLLTNHPQQRTAYEQTDKSRQEDADVIITTLQAAGVIGR